MAPISLISAGAQRTQELPDVRFEFPFKLIGKGFLRGQSWRVLKSWYTAGGPEQGFWRCFADGLPSLAQASIKTDNGNDDSGDDSYGDSVGGGF